MQRSAGLVLALWLIPCLLSAAPPSHPIVPGYERFHTGEKSDLARGGQLLLGELNCTSCHQGGDGIQRRQAPVLDNVALRVRAGRAAENG